MREVIGIAGIAAISYSVWRLAGETGLSLFVGIVLLLMGLGIPGKSNGKDAK